MKKTALITGASAGIGEAFAEIFAENSYDLVLVARNEAKLQSLASRLPHVQTTVIAKDLSESTAPQAIYNELQAKGIQIDVLVNNAGFGDLGLFHERSWEKQAQMIDLNIRALTELTYVFGKEMVARKSGKILNVASTAAFFPGPLMSIYYATKHYVLAFSEGLAEEWKPFGVTVTTLCPGPTESDFQKAADMEEARLVKGQKMPSSRVVAQYGYDAMMRGKVTTVQGFSNKFLAFSSRFAPRTILAKVIKTLHG